MFKSVSESIQKQLDNPKVKKIKLKGIIGEALHVRRSVIFTGTAIVNAPILIETGLDVSFDNAVLRMNTITGQIGVKDSFDGYLRFNNTSILHGTTLIREYEMHANSGNMVGALIVSVSKNVNLEITDSHIDNMSAEGNTANITNSDVGLLFGETSGFYGNHISVENSSISNFDFEGQVNLSHIRTCGELSFVNLSDVATVTDVILVNGWFDDKKTNELAPLLRSMENIFRVSRGLAQDAPIVVNLLRIFGDVTVNGFNFDDYDQTLVSQNGYDFAFFNHVSGILTINHALSEDDTTPYTSHVLGYQSYTNSDLKIMGEFKEEVSTGKNGKISYLSRSSDDDNRKDDDALAKLQAMIGLDSVKSQVKRIIASAAMRKRRNQPMPSLHMVFSGNAGTGKTTVAGTIADALYENGVIETSKLVVATKRDLVAGYVGQTAEKTRNKVEEAYGGVLFIDEAYTLTADSSSNGFEAEAIAELIAQMENNRDRLIVILAGYTDEMKRFMTSNQGLNSRFKTWIEFPDYSINDLTKIALSQFKASDMPITDLTAKLTKASFIKLEHTIKLDGNGRFARNFTDTVVENHDTRLFEGDDNSHLVKSDFVYAINSLIKRAQI